ncbi:MAG TPA: PEP-CTERM sorting domain-containing protein [Phycisphaerae bacterium]|nr:PEP-CTERM sorting domain-containing protein [Phycisphaerae bacterium]
MSRLVSAATVGLALLAFCTRGQAELLSIYDIQYNTSDGDATVYHGQIHDVVGGLVTHVHYSGRSRVWLRDPDHPTWGAIVVKDWEGGELADNVEVGDWVSFQNILIEEFRGTTLLQYNRNWSPDIAFNVDSTGNDVPLPTLLTAADLCVPVDHSASEPYESMMAMLEDVTVGQLDQGHVPDNYELLQGDYMAWGTDYINVDAGGPYHPFIYPGAELLSITGAIEQYTNLDEGWDHYQLLTRFTGDIVPVPEPGSMCLLIVGGLLARRRR